jgi:PAS domain S-box-containing protein
MPCNLDPLIISGMFFSITICGISFFVFRENHNKMPLFISIGFGFFTISYIMEACGNFPGINTLILIVRTFAFLTILFALYSNSGEARSQITSLSEKNRQPELEITERKHAEESQEESNSLFGDIINFLPDAIFAIDLEGKVIAWNNAIEDMTGINKEEILGTGNYSYSIPFYGERRPVLINLVLEGNNEIEKEYPHVVRQENKIISELFIPRLYEGKGAHLWFMASPLYNTRGSVIGAIESIRDVSEHKMADDKISRSLQEKEVLLQEVHHRVKNNLQVVSALIELQIQYMKDPRSINALRDSQNRIRTMALIHETLYRSHDLGQVEFATYIERLVNTLFDIYSASEETIKKVFEIANISLDVDVAIHCGLVINELVSNSFKHAFPDGRHGEIRIIFYLKNSTYHLSYSDNGVGIPEAIDFERTESLGLKLVHLLATEQLDGTIHLVRENGTHIFITFPK